MNRSTICQQTNIDDVADDQCRGSENVENCMRMHIHVVVVLFILLYSRYALTSLQSNIHSAGKCAMRKCYFDVNQTFHLKIVFIVLSIDLLKLSRCQVSLFYSFTVLFLFICTLILLQLFCFVLRHSLFLWFAQSICYYGALQSTFMHVHVVYS